MALAPSSSPLLIASIMRWNGVTTVRVVGHGFTSPAHIGQSLRVFGVADKSYNGNAFSISAVPDVNTLQYLQPTQNDNHVELAGGAISIG